MNIKKITCGITASFALLLLLPVSASAYFTTEQTATKITDHAAIYTITYKFGLNKHDIYMPVLATRALRENVDENDRVAYTIREDGEDVSLTGETSAFVFGNVPIVDGMYKIEAGTAGTMVLFVVLTTDSTTPQRDYALQIEKLTYLVDTENDVDTLDTRGLNPSELQYYVTNDITLNN